MIGLRLAGHTPLWAVLVPIVFYGALQQAVVLRRLDALGGGARLAMVLQRLLVEIGLPIFEDGLTMHVRASADIAIPEPGSTDATALMHQADLAMYEAKRRGDHTAQRYRPTAATRALSE